MYVYTIVMTKTSIHLSKIPLPSCPPFSSINSKKQVRSKWIMPIRVGNYSDDLVLTHFKPHEIDFFFGLVE